MHIIDGILLRVWQCSGSCTGIPHTPTETQRVLKWQALARPSCAPSPSLAIVHPCRHTDWLQGGRWPVLNLIGFIIRVMKQDVDPAQGRTIKLNWEIFPNAVSAVCFRLSLLFICAAGYSLGGETMPS
jgi:hypothetical protein